MVKDRLPDITVCERGLVGAVLLRPNLAGEAAGQVAVSDLSDPRTRTVYDAILSLWRRGVEPNQYTVTDELRATEQLLDLPTGYLTTLQAEVPSPNLDSYVRVILDAALRRRLALTGRTIATIAVDPTIEAGDTLDQAKELLGSIAVPLSIPSEMVDVDMFCAGEDRFDWLIPNIIERGDRILVVAAEAAGKSFLLRQIAVCSAFGIHPFSSRFGNPVRVAMLDFENPPSLVRRKLRPILHKAKKMAPLADATMMSVVCKPGGIDVSKRIDAAWLAAQLTAVQPDLVVAGPLYKMFRADDKWEQGAHAVTTVLDDLRTRLGFALVLETHAPQQFGGQRHLRPIGSSLWLRWPEFVLTFAPTDKDPHTVRLTVSKGRDERPWPVWLKRGGEWPWTPCGDPEAQAKKQMTPLVPPLPDEPPPEEQEYLW